MDEYLIPTKYTLPPKSSVNVAAKNLTVTLAWNDPVDLDLMFFYEMQDGQAGAVLTDWLPSGNLGTISAFPFINLSGDEGVGGAAGAKTETGRIEKIDERIKAIRIFAVNYDGLSKRDDSSFANYSGMIQILSDDGVHDIGVPLDDTTPGYFAHIATIEADGKITSEDKVLSPPEFFEGIPGAKIMIGQASQPTL